MSKKVLIISYHYPPDLAIGAIRSEKFVKYLPDFGYEPVVLTVKEKYYDNINSVPSNDCDNCFINRSFRFPNFRDIYLVLKNKLPSNFQSKDNLVRQNPTVKTIQESAEPFRERLKRYFNSIVVWSPDDKNGWIIPALWRGLCLIRQHNIAAIYTTGPPHSVHIAGLFLKILTGKIWVSDFRDPWRVQDKPVFIRSKLSDIIENYFIKMVVKKSDTVVSVTPEMTDLFHRNYSKISPDKFITIYNGYDSEEFVQYNSIQKYKKVTFAYAGSFYLGRDPEIFLTAIKNLIDRKQIKEDQIDIHFIGNCRYLYERSIEKMVVEIGLKKIVRFTDIIPRHEALMEMAKSHILLLLAQNQPLQIPGKLYEYIGLQRIILGVCGPGATANILKNYDHAVVVSEDNTEAMEEALLKVTSMATSKIDHINDTAEPNTQQFERKKLAGELANIFNLFVKN